MEVLTLNSTEDFVPVEFYVNVAIKSNVEPGNLYLITYLGALDFLFFSVLLAIEVVSFVVSIVVDCCWLLFPS